MPACRRARSYDVGVQNDGTRVWSNRAAFPVQDGHLRTLLLNAAGFSISHYQLTIVGKSLGIKRREVSSVDNHHFSTPDSHQNCLLESWHHESNIVSR
jgi:hypothetical protein